MSHLLQKYYRGITEQLRSEVDFINSLFQHRGLQGEGNEVVLRDLITRFVPRRYGVGTGVVVDRHGTPSNQCDIVVYDTFLYPSLFSLTSVHLFPVDIVYATIEIKTTLDSTKVRGKGGALDNVASVRRLDFIPGGWSALESLEIPPGVNKGGVALKKHEATPPFGVVFAYNSEARKFETFKNWFVPKSATDAAEYPTLVGCLDQGIVQFHHSAQQAGTEPKGWALPVIVDEGEFLTVPEEHELWSHNGLICPVKCVKGEYVAIDQSRVLLLFLLTLNELLSQAEINPRIRFTEHYLSDEMIRAVLV
jgi:hypothetical protein